MKLPIGAGVLLGLLGTGTVMSLAAGEIGQAVETSSDLDVILALVAAITAPACGALGLAVRALYRDNKEMQRRIEKLLRDTLTALSDRAGSRSDDGGG